MARATVVGSGPNGLAAAVTLARAGYSVRVVESSTIIGGGASSAESTLPGFIHDIGSAVHPGAYSSPFFRAFGLDQHLEWIIPSASYAHPLDGGRAAVAWRDIDRTASELGVDGRSWRALLQPLVQNLDGVLDFTGSSLLRFPRYPITAARFGLRVLAHGSALGRFRTEHASALLAGVIAHANTRMPSLTSAAAGLLLAAQGHAGGWPYPRGGAQAITDALITDLQQHGGVIETDTMVRDLSRFDWGDPAAGDLLLINGSPRLALTLPNIPAAYTRALHRYRYGTAAAKVDFALDGPVPWANASVALAPTVHLGGSRAEVVASENTVAQGRVSDSPYVLVSQPSVGDPTRAPSGKAVLWAYMHVPAYSTLDPTEPIIRQIERFAPGFRDRILATHAVPAVHRETVNPAAIGGDIFGGAFSLTQALRRPTVSPAPWRTPMPGVYLASASTPPGPGVNGMAGWHAAATALADAGTPVTLSGLFS